MAPRSTATFLVPLIYDTTTNQTQVWDQSSKYLPPDNEINHERIKTILAASRERTSERRFLLF